MDITRHWRTKPRGVLQAVRISSGEYILPNQTSIPSAEAKGPPLYTFEEESPSSTDENLIIVQEEGQNNLEFNQEGPESPALAYGRRR